MKLTVAAIQMPSEPLKVATNLGRADASYGYSAWGRTVTAGLTLKL